MYQNLMTTDNLPLNGVELNQRLVDICKLMVKSKDEPITEDESILSEIISRPEEFGESPIPKEDNMYRKFQDFFGGGFAARKLLYDDFRDRVQEFQVANNISGLELVKIVISGIEIEVHEELDQLILLEKDREILTSEVPKYFDFLLEMLGTGNYNLVESMDEEDKPASVQEVELYLPFVKAAHVFESSKEWVRKGDRYSGQNIEREFPDLIEFSFYQGYFGDSPSKHYALLNNDTSRFPWMVHND